MEAFSDMVEGIAGKLKGQLSLPCEMAELVNAGYQGLLEARSRYDASRGVAFRAFAYFRVRGAILDAVRKMTHAPPRVHARVKAAEAQDDLTESAALDRVSRKAIPTRGEDALAQLDGILGVVAQAYVLSCVASCDERDDFEMPDEAASFRLDYAHVEEALHLLPDVERLVVQRLYFDDKKLDHVAAEIGASRSWVSRLHAKALTRLRTSLSDAPHA